MDMDNFFWCRGDGCNTIDTDFKFKRIIQFELMGLPYGLFSNFRESIQQKLEGFNFCQLIRTINKGNG
jgi:hypothetical protein